MFEKRQNSKIVLFQCKIEQKLKKNQIDEKDSRTVSRTPQATQKDLFSYLSGASSFKSSEQTQKNS